jgi:CHAT domain-containing protein/tetratricopeptide (TPR) repeat protein
MWLGEGTRLGPYEVLSRRRYGRGGREGREAGVARGRSRTTRVVVSLCAGLVIGSQPAAQVSPETARGVVVAEVVAGSVASRGGLQVGDVLLTWTREAALPANPAEASGAIESPFDLVEARTEQAPRGRITLIGTRGGQQTRWTLPSGTWGVKVCPMAMRGPGCPPSAASSNEPPSEPAKQWLALAGAQDKRANGWIVPWQLSKAAEALVTANQWTEVDATYARAVEETSGAPAYVGAQLLNDWGASLGKRNAARAKECFERALTLRRQAAPDSLAVADSLYRLADLESDRRDLVAAERLTREALAIQERLAPGSLEVADSLNGLGVVEGRRDNLAEAERFFRQALAIQEKVAPDSLELATALSNIGSVFQARRDAATSAEFHRRALTIRERLLPNSRQVATNLGGLATAAMLSGDFAAAEDFSRQALRIHETIERDSHDVAGDLANLGSIAAVRGDLRAADGFYSRALNIYRKSLSYDPQIAQIMAGIAMVALIRSHAPTDDDSQQRAELSKAEGILRGMVTLAAQFAPANIAFAEALYALGITARFRGDLTAASDAYRRSLAILDRLAPDSLLTALVLSEMAGAASQGSQPSEAERDISRALKILERQSQPTWIEGLALNQLALASGRVHQPDTAARLHARAIDAAEQEEANLGGGDARALFGMLTATIYREAVQAQAETGRLAESLHSLERSRARTLLHMLAERDLRFAGDLPAETARALALNRDEYDRVLWTIARLDPVRDTDQVAPLEARLQSLRDDREELTAKVRQASPRYAALRYPEPLDLAGVRATLDPGTVLLSYSVGKDKTLLFVVRPAADRGGQQGVVVLTLPIGEQRLREEVATFRRAIQRPALVPDAGADVRGIRRVQPPELDNRLRSLYDLLIRPAERHIASSQRVLISPDGPLHGLPFGALVRKEANRRPSYFVEWKPLHVVASATLYAQLRQERNTRAAGGESALVAFGDPVYPAADAASADALRDVTVRSTLRRGNALWPLPATGREVRAIAELYGPGAQVFVQEDATEERAKAVGRGPRYLHFASHGILDQRFPLNSGLALTIPEAPAAGQENGLLQAWEVFDHVRIDADLVTLSACETGLGAEMGGEGLVGLVRAFQYAGARSVAASLWSVEDDSTATLMTKFYMALKAGKPKDEALRWAQLAVLRDQRTASPFYWAAFQLYGDWR